MDYWILGKKKKQFWKCGNALQLAAQASVGVSVPEGI